jgi:ssDNA-binding Zn-finger/Zn-ribbon topoisomerase 1
MTKQLTYLVEVTGAVEDWITSHGAYFDKNVSRWVVEGEVPPELESYVEKPKRVRNHLAERTPQCELCGCQMLLRNSTYGEFWSCSAFPRCKGKRSVAADDYGLCMTGDEFSYVEENAVQAQDNRDKSVDFSAGVVEKPGASTLKPAEAIKDQCNVVERAQGIYDRATQLFGSRKTALNWLTSIKVGLGHKSPVDVMRTTKGCDLVEKLLNERFDTI